MIDINSLALKQTIRFKILSPHDTMYHTGTITSICDYETAKLFSDVDVTYQEIVRSGKSVTAKEAETYYKLTYTNESNVSQATAFGKTWIDQATLELVSENTRHDIRLYDVDVTTATAILKSIQAMGYTAEIVNN